MMLDNEWKRKKPKEPMTTLAALWRDFKWRRKDKESPLYIYRDNIPDACARAVTADEAIRLAVRSVRPNGKMHSHQGKVSPALPKYEKILLANLKDLRRCENFHALWLYCQELACKGIGALTVYDVATRFGAYLKVEPRFVYSHTGVAMGLAALGISMKGKEYISLTELPPPLNRLKATEADEIEDFLCCYREAFRKLVR